MSPLFVQITGSYPPKTCGIGDYTAHLARHLRGEGARVEIWTRATELLAEDGRGMVPAWTHDHLRTIGQSLRKERPSVVHLQYEPGVYDSHPAILSLPRYVREAGASLVTTFHSLDGPKAWGRAHRAALIPLLLGSRDITVCSGRQFSLLSRIPRLRERVKLIPIGSNIDPVSIQSDPANAPPTSGSALRLIYFGFVWRGRNIELLLRALSVVHTHTPDATLEIVGGLRDNTYHQELLMLAQTLGVASHVHFSGDLDAPAVSGALHRSDIALLPYSSGVSTGRGTLMAALAHGLPLATFAVPDNLSPLFTHGENMMLASAGDNDTFLANTSTLAADPALRARLARGATLLSARFDWAQIACQMLALPSYASHFSQQK